MSEKPILFSAPMVRALLEGRKMMTRRVLKPQPSHVWGYGNDGRAHVRYPGGVQPDPWIKLRYSVGDVLWVRETLMRHETLSQPICAYAATTKYPNADLVHGKGTYWPDNPSWRWERDILPSIYMPRCASRISLTVTAVRVERLQEITEEDCLAEGYEGLLEKGPPHVPAETPSEHPVWWFQNLWDSINGKKHPWASNPWVEVYGFEVMPQQGIGGGK